MKRKQLWIGLAISAVFLYWAFKDSDFGAIWQQTRQVAFLWILASVPVTFLQFFLRAVRWRYLLLPQGRPSLHSLFGTIMIGFMSLNVLPLRIGEFVRAYVLSRREPITMSSGFATIVVERIFDGFGILLYFFISLFFLPSSLSEEFKARIQIGSAIMGAIYVSAILFLVVLKYRPNWVAWGIRVFLGRLPKLRSLAEKVTTSFVAGLAAVGRRRLFLIISFWTLLIWATNAGYFYVCMRAFSVAGHGTMAGQVGYMGACFLMGIVAFGVMLPSSPGFVGTFQFACITALTTMGVAQAPAEAFAILVHAAQYVPTTLVGIIYLYFQHFSLREVQVGAAEVQAVENA